MQMSMTSFLHGEIKEQNLKSLLDAHLTRTLQAGSAAPRIEETKQENESTLTYRKALVKCCLVIIEGMLTYRWSIAQELLQNHYNIVSLPFTYC